MSRVTQVLKNKNKREKADKQKKRQDMAAMQLESAYRAKLYDEMRRIDLMLEDENVDTVRIEVPPNYLSQFTKAMYAEEMSEYSISQIDTNIFDVGRKIINF